MPKPNPLAAAAQALINAEACETASEDLTALLDSSAKATATAVPPAQRRKQAYTAAAMVQLFIDHPEYSHAQYAEHFGYRSSWFAGVLISPNLQAALDPRRAEVSVVNPAMAGTLQEMFQAVTVQALAVLQTRLEDPKVSESLLLAAAGLGVKALGLGTNHNSAPPPPAPRNIHDLASNLLQHSPKAVSDTPARDLTIDITLQEVAAPSEPDE